MRQTKRRSRFGWVALGVIAMLSAGLLLTLHPLKGRSWWFPKPFRNVATTAVQQSDLNVSRMAMGKVESEERTLIRCELQNLEIRNRGQGMSSGGASTVISLVPDGTMVKEGDVLCRLDSSNYEEMVRQQQIIVERSKAEFRQAELTLDVAKLALLEFRDGSMLQDLKVMKAQIAMADSDVQHAADRLTWVKRMHDKGYASVAQLRADELNCQRSQFALKQNRVALTVYEKFTAPRNMRTLESQITAADAMLSFQQAKLQRNEERLETLNRQVERCTIRAPHNGMVVYANDPNKAFVIEEGMSVRQKQTLFYLPDLSKMEIDTLFHETVIKKVRSGMRARVRIEGLPGRVLDGHVIKIAQLATQNFLSDVRYYSGIVKLDTIPKGLLPGMTAEVEVMTDRLEEVLTVPPEAVAFENGLEVCYVAHDGNLERRQVKVGESNRDRVEVTEGLEKGEQVVLDAESVDKDAVTGLTAETDREHPVTGQLEHASVTH